MAYMEHENDTYRETLAQFRGKMDLFQGNMDVIMEYLHAHKVTTSANTITDVVTDATVIIITIVDTTANIVIQHVARQPIYQPGPSRHVVVYPWGMPLNYTP